MRVTPPAKPAPADTASRARGHPRVTRRLGVIAIVVALALPARAATPAERIAAANTVASADRALSAPTDVVALGADPSGQRDSWPAFRAAAMAKRDVRLPCGRFVISRAVALAGGERWLGAGACTVLAPLPGDPTGLFVAEGQDDIVVAGLALDGARDTIGSDIALATIVNGSRIVFRDLTVAHTRGIALAFGNTRQSGVKDARFADIGTFNAGKPAGAAGPSDPQMALNFNDRGGGAPDPRDRGNFVLDCTFTGLGGSAAAATQQIGFTFAGNRVENGDAIWSRGQELLRGNAFTGIYLHLTDGALVAGNRIAGMSGNGIDTEDNAGLAIAGNLVSGNAMGGIDIAGPVRDFVVAGNVSFGNGRATGMRPGNTGENAAITFGAQPLMAPAQVAFGVLAGNLGLGRHGLQAFPHVRPRAVWVDPTNILGPGEGPVGH